MKKIVAIVGSILCCTVVSFADSYMPQTGSGSLFGNEKQKTGSVQTSSEGYGVRSGQFGLGIRTGVAQNDPKDMKDAYNDAFDYGWTHKKLSKNAAVFGIEALYEWGEEDKVGIKLGVEGYGQNKLELDHGDYTAKENTYAFPLTAYYKKDNGIKAWSWFAGAGLTLINSEIKDDYYGDKETYHKSKVFPHLVAGAEYRFCKLFALGIEAKYNIAAKVKKDGGVLSDRSGIGAAITGRFYF